MTFNSPNDSSSIFEDGRLKPGIYKIQNLHSQTYLDIHEHSRETCCRPAQNLGEGKGLWRIEPLEAGYSIQRVELGKPKQFCTPMEGLSNGTPLYVAAFPVAWRIEVFDDDKYRGFEYVRIFWGTTKRAWDLDYGRADNGAKVQSWEYAESRPVTWRMWKLIPAKVEGKSASPQSSSGAFGSGSLPPYNEDTPGRSSTRVVESEQDEFGTIVNEVTVVTTTSTVTTRKKYRVEQA